MTTDLEEAIRKVVIDRHDHEIDEAMARLMWLYALNWGA